MADTLGAFLDAHPLLVEEGARGRTDRRFRLALPELPPERAVSAWLVLPSRFPAVRARIELGDDAVLRVPHVEFSGNLCFDGDYGPASGATAESRIEDMLERFISTFLAPWLDRKLDGDFERETANYWAIYVERQSSQVDAVRRIYTLDGRGAEPRIREAQLLLPDRAILVGDRQLAARFTASLGPRASQVCNTIVADIPVDYPFTPSTWPANTEQLHRLLSCRLSDAQLAQFTRVGPKKIHKVVLLRAPTASYAFLLPGGPPTVVARDNTKKAYPTRKLLPLKVERLDPHWTSGRDQHLQVAARQASRVLILGGGAIGSPVLEQLARAGVGNITVVDPDVLSASNLGRHLLGADKLGLSKAKGLELQVGRAMPSCRIKGADETAQAWLQRNTLQDVDVVLDLTGEPDVRFAVELARNEVPRPLLVGWLEPFVAAAHACVLLPADRWLGGRQDPLLDLQAVEWPADVIQCEPGCSSDFQSYTAAAATYGIGLITEAALELVDGVVDQPQVRSWVRSQRYFDAQYPGLEVRAWARTSLGLDAAIVRRPWP